MSYISKKGSLRLQTYLRFTEQEFYKTFYSLITYSIWKKAFTDGIKQDEKEVTFTNIAVWSAAAADSSFFAICWRSRRRTVRQRLNWTVFRVVLIKHVTYVAEQSRCNCLWQFTDKKHETCVAQSSDYDHVYADDKVCNRQSQLTAECSN